MIEQVQCPHCERKTYHEFYVDDVDDIIFLKCDKCKKKMKLEFEYKIIASKS
jgi:transcription elongation factor Elf1